MIMGVNQLEITRHAPYLPVSKPQHSHVSKPTCNWLVIACHNSASGAQKFKLRTSRNEPFHGVEDLDNVCPVGSNKAHSNGPPAVQVLVPDFGNRHVEAAPQLGNERSDNGPLALQRVNIA